MALLITTAGAWTPMASPQTVVEEWEQVPGVMIPMLDTRIQLSPSFPGYPKSPAVSRGPKTYQTPRRETPRSWCHCSGTLC